MFCLVINLLRTRALWTYLTVFCISSHWEQNLDWEWHSACAHEFFIIIVVNTKKLLDVVVGLWCSLIFLSCREYLGTSEGLGKLQRWSVRQHEVQWGLQYDTLALQCCWLSGDFSTYWWRSDIYLWIYRCLSAAF